MLNMTVADCGSPVNNETVASTSNRITSGLMQACPRIRRRRYFNSLVTMFGP